MKHIIVVLFLFVHPLYKLSCQTTFNRYYDFDTAGWAWGLSVTEDDGSFVTLSQTIKKLPSAVDPIKSVKALLFLKFDANGDTISRRIFYADSTFYHPGYNSIMPVSTSGYIAGLIYADYDFSANDSIRHVFRMMRFSEMGDSLWTRDFYRFDDSWGLMARETSDHGFIGAGWSTWDSLGDDEAYVVKTDSNGNLEWEGPHYLGEDARTVFEFGDKEYYMGGSTYLAAGLGDRDGNIALIDSSGAKVFNHVYGTEGADNFIYPVVSADSSYFLFYQPVDSFDYWWDNLIYSVGRLDLEGNEIWRSYLIDEQYIWSITPTHDGGLAICGYGYDGEFDYTGFIMKFDAEGNKLWDHFYYSCDSSSGYLTSIDETADHGFIATGIGCGVTWLLKVDSMGCEIPGCESPLNIFDQQVRDNSILNVYPNPVTSNSVVEIIISNQVEFFPGKNLSLEIYDISGKLIDHYPNIPISNPNTTIRIPINKNGLSPGRYFIQLLQGAEKIGETNFVVG